MVNNLIPLFLANALGARTGTIGLVEGVAESMSSLIKLLSGWWSDRVVSRKPPTVAGYAVSAFSKPLLALAGSWTAVLAVRFGDRLGKGVRTAPRDALLADSVPAERRGAAFGFHRAGDSLGAVVGLGLALLVVWLTQGNALTLSRATFQRIALFSAVPGVLAVVVLLIGLREVRREAPSAGRPILGSFRGMPPSFRRFLLIFGLFTLGNSADAFIILRAQERGLSVAGVLAMLLVFNVVYTAVAGPAGRLSDRVGRPRLILAGWAVYAAIYLGLALAGAAWQVVALFIAYGTYHGLVEGNARAFVADLVGAESAASDAEQGSRGAGEQGSGAESAASDAAGRVGVASKAPAAAGRGAAYGLYHATVGLATLPASLIAGALWQGVGDWTGFGPAAPFLFGAALAAALFALFLAPTFRSPRPVGEG
jgi:MFS family permease